jgi:hypothetical protein
VWVGTRAGFGAWKRVRGRVRVGVRVGTWAGLEAVA